MKKFICVLLTSAAMVITSCNRAERPFGTAECGVDGIAGEMTIDLLLPVTPVKNQGGSSTCWIYAMLAIIETDRIVMGDSVNLSADYLVRRWLEDKAMEVHLGGKTPSLRGMMPSALRLMERYGMMGYDAYHTCEGISLNVVARKMARAASVPGTAGMMKKRVEAVLDDGIGYLPAKVYMLGAEYTPMEFAHSIYQPGDWLAVTSFTHHPYGENFILETPDNVMADSFLNVELDSMMCMVETSLRQGHPVGWEGDISEKGFDAVKGMAMLDNEPVRINARMRQKAFECRITTDDHCMALVGIAHDAKGRKYYVAKNSWGTAGKSRGFVYMSENYLRMKTIALMINKLTLNKNTQLSQVKEGKKEVMMGSYDGEL